MAALALAFLVIAALYASVGFGGGSSYAALLALWGVDYRVLPVVALGCNIVVVAGSSLRFARARVTPWRGALALTALGAPAALLGGITPISREPFLAILAVSLIASGFAMLLPRRSDNAKEGSERFSHAPRLAMLASPILGYLAGLVGIGGGIFLAPLLHLMRWNHARAIAATASFFILVNSLFGLAGQILKGGPELFGQAFYPAWPLLVAVAIGGQIGSLLALRWFSARAIRGLTAVLVILVGARVLLTA